MRAISQYGEFSLQVRPQRVKAMGDGTAQIVQEPIYAKFSRDGVIYDAEIEKAEKVFAFRGRFQHIDEATPADVMYRLSVLDTTTQGWSDEDRELVEAELLRKENLTNDFFISDHRPLQPPFPAWDESEKPAFQLVASLVDMGFDLSAALDYERSFGPKREAVIEALEETIKDQQLETIPA